MENLLRRHTGRISIIVDSFLNVCDLSGEQDSYILKRILENNDDGSIKRDWYRVGGYIKSAIRNLDNER